MEREGVSSCVLSFAICLLAYLPFPPFRPPPLPPLPPSLLPSLTFSPYLIKDHHKRYTRQAKARLECLLGGGVDEEMREVGPFPVDEAGGGREDRGREEGKQRS